MDATLFTENQLGELVTAGSSGGGLAFVPDALPKEWTMPASMWPLLMEARESLARLDGVGRHLANPRLLLAPLQQREALRSSSMEGTYATPEELLLYQMDPREPRSETDQVNAWREVFNYGQALHLGMQRMAEGVPLSLRLIREMHATLLDGVRGHNRRPGVFRDCQVQVGVGGRYVPPPPSRIMACLDAFEKYHHDESGVDPLLRAFMAHYQFETIHPFTDGNGRTGRLLLSLTICQWLGLNNPWLYMSAFFERHKDEYIDRLFMVSADGQWERWLSFCLQGVVEQAHDTVRRIDQLVGLREAFRARVSNSGGNARLHAIVERLFAAPVVTIPQVVTVAEVSYPTAKADVLRLIDLDILAEHRLNTTPQLYLAPAIFEVAYGDATS